MFENLSLFPEAASTVAGRIDGLYFFLVAMTTFATAGVCAALLYFCIRYRRKHDVKSVQIAGSIPLEIFWSAVPFFLWVGVFVWGAKVYLEVNTPPIEGMQFYVTGKQWMWKIQHPTGHTEINSLHVPVGEPVILTMISEDVIHDFYVPEFRVKNDVLPGRYTRVWFEATKVGSYKLLCAEYCGTDHSRMIGQVVVMDPADYQTWLSGADAGEEPVEAGRKLFENLRCVTCHAAASGQRGPDLANRFGLEADVDGGRRVLFDEDYIRNSILEPKRHISTGFQPLMPTYEGQINEGQIQNLIAYIKSLSSEPGTTEEQ